MSFISLSSNKLHSEHPPFLLGVRGGGGDEPPTKFSKRGCLTGSHFSDLKISEGGCWERGGGFFQRGLHFSHKKVYKTMFLSVITKNLNWKVLTKNLVTFKR